MKYCPPPSALLFPILALTAPCAHAVLFINDDFFSPSYSVIYVSPADPTDQSYFTFADFVAGGNPTSYRTITHEHDLERGLDGSPVNGTGQVTLQTILLENSATYQPSSDGPIQTLSFSIDVRSSRPASVYFNFANQANSSFAGGFTPFTASAIWQTITVSGLMEADFIGSNFATSDQLKFGFGFVSSANVTARPTTFNFDVDNFKVTIVPVPEPSSAFLAGLASLALCQRRRR
jgi:PEP-CTERM motif